MVEIPHNATERTITTNGIDLHTIIAGPDDGEPVFLFHGFPEFWYGWHNQISDLTAAGYRLIIPDQRGYNLSSKPKGVGAYTMAEATADVLGLIDHFGYEEVSLVGHDWGGAVVWHVLAEAPSAIKRAIVMNAPHPMTFARSLLRPGQALRNLHMLWFQLPRVPEKTLRAANWWILRRRFLGRAKIDFSPEVMRHYRQAWDRPGALSGMLNWYRAMRQGLIARAWPGEISPDTMVIWGLDDPYFPREMARRSVGWCDRGHLVELTEATHWLHHEQPASVNDRLIEFLP